MSNGRSTWRITLRLPDSVRAELDKRAEKRGESIAQYLQNAILRSACATKPVPDVEVPNDVHAQSHSACTTSVTSVVNPSEPNHSACTTKPGKAELQNMIHSIEQGEPQTPTKVTLPICDASNFKSFKPGDKVLARQGRRLVETVIPALDADGQAMPV